MAEFGLTEEQQREFTEAFNDTDKNRTGYITASELNVLMRSLGHTLTDDEIRSAVTSSDLGISVHDFLTLIAKREQDVALQGKLVKAFSVFDRDGSGFISSDELRMQMTSLGANPFTDAEYDLFVSEYVAEAPALQGLGHPAMEDGLIDYQEFIKLMLRKVP
mmetsp:Transcript_64592/g.154338  ORF Transcript_64592/g.154338 Transcript_64592/m.154338 type:complete len:162 (-) Transcript_64592:135-620(-)